MTPGAPLRVLQVIPTLDRAGAEKQLVLLAKGLPADRFAVEVAALTRLGPLEADLRAAGIPVTLFKKRFKVDPLALAGLARFMNKKKFDVVNTWIFAGHVYGRIAAHLAKVPVVIASEMAVDLWKRKAQLRLDRWLAGWTDVVVGNSGAVVEFYKSHGIPEAKLQLIHSGIGLVAEASSSSLDVRREFEISPDSPLFLFAGRLAPQKGVADLLDALDVLQHVEPGAVTLIAGDGPLRKALLQRAQSLTLLQSKRVRFLGPRDDVGRLMAAADVVVLPSLYEGLPNVVMEAMALGKPVVATAAPGTTELVVDGETGLLAPIGTPRELCRALRRLARDRELRAGLGAAGRQRVIDHFHVDTMIRGYAALYESLVRRKRGRPQ